MRASKIEAHRRALLSSVLELAMKSLPLVLISLVASMVFLGCGVEDPCRVICEKEATCGFSETGDIETCVAQCETFYEDDPEYAEAIDERAACIEDTVCDEIFSECRPSGE